MTDRRPWTDDELGFIADHPDWSARRVGEALGRTKDGVQNMRERLRKGWARTVEPWTLEEDQILLDLGEWATAQQLALALPGRTRMAVSLRRQRLGVKTAPPNDLIAHRLGGRPLVAKTCTTCRLLLPASWYRWRPKDRCWTASCRKCQAVTTDEWFRQNPRPSGDPTNQFLHRMKTLTEPRADRNAEPYTEKDHEVLSDPDLDLLQKALKLGRTYAAVSQACSAFEYKSHVGLGEPTDLWRIFNPNEIAA